MRIYFEREKVELFLLWVDAGQFIQWELIVNIIAYLYVLWID